MKGVTGRRRGVRDEWVRGRNAYQLVSDGRPSPSLQCSSDWSRQTSLRIVSAWVKIGRKKGLNRAVCSTGMREDFGTRFKRSGVTKTVYTCLYRIAANFQGRKLSQISRFCDYMKKFSPRNLGCGILRHSKNEQFAKVFSAKIVFSPICESFLP